MRVDVKREGESGRNEGVENWKGQIMIEAGK